MGATVKELQSRMDSAEFAEHYADYQILPFGGGEHWKQTAQIVATLINVNSKRKVRVEDCLPGREARQQQSDAEMQARLDLFFRAMLKRQQKKEREATHGRD